MHYALGNKYPIETKEQVKLASEYFSKHYTRLDPSHRVVVAANLEKRASETGVDLDKGWITNYSRMTKESKLVSPTFESNLMMRKEAAAETVVIDGKEVKVSDTLDKIAELKQAGMHGDLLVSTISEFDKTAGLESGYDYEIMDPVMTVYGNLPNPKFDAIKIAGELTDYEITSASNNERVLRDISSTFSKEAAQKFNETPLIAMLELDSPELKIMTDIIGG